MDYRKIAGLYFVSIVILGAVAGVLEGSASTFGNLSVGLMISLAFYLSPLATVTDLAGQILFPSLMTALTLGIVAVHAYGLHRLDSDIEGPKKYVLELALVLLGPIAALAYALAKK
jgi:hypothetical protein